MAGYLVALEQNIGIYRDSSGQNMANKGQNPTI